MVRSIRDLTVVKQLYEGLMRFDQENKLAPALASSIEISEDGCNYTFFLREAYWSNKEQITAYDFVRSLKMVLSKDFPTDYASMLFPIKNAKAAKMGLCPLEEVAIIALDEKRLSITLERALPYFLELTAFPTYFPVHSKDKNIYSGPFKLKSMQYEYSLILEKNPTYWDKEKVGLDEIHFSMITDVITEAHLFEKGELDWLGQPLSGEISTEYLAKAKRKVSSYPVIGTLWLAFNTDIFPFNHTKVRQALSVALNRQEMITHILQGGQQVATSPIPSLMNLHHEAYFLDGDQRAAQTLLQEAYGELSLEKLPPITLTFNATRRNHQLAAVMQNQLEESLGIKVNLESTEDHIRRQKIKSGDFEIVFGDWCADFNDPVTFLELFTLPRSYGLNATNWISNHFVSLIEAASIEKDNAKRYSLLEKAEGILMNEMPIAPIYHWAFDYIKSECVEGVVLSPLGIADFKYAKKNR